MERSNAIRNNIALYRGVLSAHGITGFLEDHYWATDEPVPPYYSNLVTVTGAAGTDAQLERLSGLSASPPKMDWSFKDSWAALDPAAVEALGLRLLFDARWYGLAPETELLEPLRGGQETEAVVLSSASDLAAWEACWQESSPVEKGRVFPSALLDESSLFFLGCFEQKRLCAGALLNLSEGEVGVSNVFSSSEAEAESWLACVVRYARRRFPGQPLVGYGPAPELALLQTWGFEDLGPLRVWISDASSPTTATRRAMVPA